MVFSRNPERLFRVASLVALVLLVVFVYNYQADGQHAATRAVVTHQWLLKSYNEKTGYIFQKEAIEYQANCISKPMPVPGVPPFEPSEVFCSDLLDFAGKPLNVESREGLLYVTIKNHWNQDELFRFRIARLAEVSAAKEEDPMTNRLLNFVLFGRRKTNHETGESK